MPELPEVETVVRYIQPKVVNKTINAVVPQNDYKKVLATHSTKDFNYNIRNKVIIDVVRRGKYIVLVLENGFLLIHLRMTGRLLLELSEDDKPRHLTAIIEFADNSSLYFKDYRKFGRFYYYGTMDFINAKLGIEPLSPDFTD